MNKRKIGEGYEKRAARYLEEKGYRILEQNVSSRFGEIDLIAHKDEYLVFIEVKYRKDENKGKPEEAVDERKQKKIIKTAEYYCMKKGISMNQAMRFDVVCILGNEIWLYENAFWR